MAAASRGIGRRCRRQQIGHESQKIEVEGFTVESLADGTYYRGEFYGQDGFWLRVRITNTSDKPLDRFSFTTNAAPGNL